MSYASDPYSQQGPAATAPRAVAAPLPPRIEAQNPPEAVASRRLRPTLSSPAPATAFTVDSTSDQPHPPRPAAAAAAAAASASAGADDPVDHATTDHADMLAVRAGDLARLGLLFERHHRPLYGFFVRLLGQPATAEDLVQTVFLRMLKYRHTYRDDGRFTTWMYHLARHAAADHHRKSAAAPSLLEEPEAIHDLPDHRPAADEAAARADDLAYMRRALARLPAEQRELLTLHRFQRLRHDELAALYGCTVGTMKVRVHRAVAALRTAFFTLRGEALPD